MCPIKESRWSGTMAITVMSAEGNVRCLRRMNWSLLFWNLRKGHQRNAGKTGQGLSASGGLIQKIYEVDPLTCPKCSGKMKVISVIEDEDVIKKILKHLGLWDRKTRSPPQKSLKKTSEYIIDYSTSQLPASDKWLYVDVEYLSPDAWFIFRLIAKSVKWGEWISPSKFIQFSFILLW